MEHKCIKPSCSNTYRDNKVDAYYCSSCQENNKRIAEQIDKMPKRSYPSSDLQRYENAPKGPGGFPYAKSL